MIALLALALGLLWWAGWWAFGKILLWLAGGKA
jgi:hypothetical protein